MRVNEYNTLEEFIYEYSDGRSIPSDNLEKPKYMGIEFKFHDKYYRMCREPLPENEEDYIILPNGEVGRYDVLLLNCEEGGYPLSDNVELVGWYSDLNDVLENCIIDDIKFKDVIMDDSTEILGKDWLLTEF